jgi:hypothetical protein
MKVPLWVDSSHLVVDPFRGFQRKQPFDLGNPINIFYGSKGTRNT